MSILFLITDQFSFEYIYCILLFPEPSRMIYLNFRTVLFLNCLYYFLLRDQLNSVLKEIWLLVKKRKKSPKAPHLELLVTQKESLTAPAIIGWALTAYTYQLLERPRHPPALGANTDSFCPSQLDSQLFIHGLKPNCSYHWP